MVTRGRFLDYVDRLSETRILVIGPAVVERDVHCSVTRLAPDHPVPVFLRESESTHPGVAALTAATIANLGGQVTLVSPVGRGRAGLALRDLLSDAGIALHESSGQDAYASAELLRFLAQGRQMMQVRRGWVDYQFRDVGELVAKACDAQKFDCICVVDGLPATLSAHDLDAISGVARQRGIATVFDAAGHDLVPSAGCFEHLIFNSRESQIVAQAMTDGVSIELSGTDPVDRVRQLSCTMKAHVLLTQGRSGALLGSPSSGPDESATLHPITVSAHGLADRRGVGYVLSGVFSALIAIGAKADDAADLACQAASVAAAQPGPKRLNRDDLLRITYREIESHVADGIDVFSRIRDDHLPIIDRAARLLMEAYNDHRQVLVFGNGGSAAEANHLVGELTGRFKESRPGLPAISLSANDSVTTCLANDYGYDDVFARQIDTFCREGDVVIGLSTSGKSANVVRAMERARQRGARVIAFAGEDGGAMSALADVSINVPSRTTARIQEAHLFVIHVLCDMLDRRLDDQGRLHPEATEM